MHIISRAPFDEAAKRYPNDALALIDIYKSLKHSTFRHPDEMKKTFSSLDRMKYRSRWWVINVGGNNLRILFYADSMRDDCLSNTLSAMPPMTN